MRKKCWIIIWLLLIITLVLIGVYLFTVYGYVKGELEDSQRAFNYHKSYMINLSFEGKIQKKINEVLYNHDHRYSIKLNLYKLNPKPSFGEQDYPTYYEFKNDSVLFMSVSQSVFSQIRVNQEINKKVKDYYIEINEKKIQLLSKSKDKWLP